jgi:hypothetical protein
MALSTMPTSTSSIEPLQNQSTMRCTALAATRPRASGMIDIGAAVDRVAR